MKKAYTILVNNKSIWTGIGVMVVATYLLFLNVGYLPYWLIAAIVIFFYMIYMFYLILNRLQEQKERLLIHRDEIIGQTQALMHIHQNVKVRGYIPPMVPWSASPDFISIIMQQIIVRKPKVIVELGSGVSTIIVASMIKERDLGIQLFSIDHDEHYGNQTLEHLKLHDLSDYVDVQIRPLKTYDIASNEYNWYKWDEEETLEIDLLIVDGPPGSTNKQSRYPALPVLKNNLNKEASILVDDADRPDESRMISRWIQEFECYKAMEWKTDKGTVEVIYDPSSSHSD